MKSPFFPTTLLSWFVAKAQYCLQHRAEFSPFQSCGQNPNSSSWLQFGSWKTSSLSSVICLADQSSGKELDPSSPSPPQIRIWLKIPQILLFSACITSSWSKLLLCLLLLPVVLVLHFPCLCSAFSARLKILAKSRKALPSAGCVLQGQIGGRNSNRKKAKLLKSSLMERLVGSKCHLAQGRQNFRVWCCSVARDVSTSTD